MTRGRNEDKIVDLLLKVPQEVRDDLVHKILEEMKTGALGRVEVNDGPPHPDNPVAEIKWRQRRVFREFVPASRKQIRKALSSRQYPNLEGFIDGLRSARKESSLTNLRDAVMDLASYMTEIEPGSGELVLSRKAKEILVGDIQSGKSEAAMALVATAVDLGCRVTVVLAGTNDKLRNQTQARFDGDLIAVRPNLMSPTTTGDIVTYRENNKDSEFAWHQMKDNVRQFLEADGSNAVILVVKKHAKKIGAVHKLLGHIRHWGLLNDQPILVIDDESDQAGQNRKTECYDPEDESSDASSIHKSLVNMVAEFQTLYWGMTATAAGAVVLHPKDFLFPNQAHVLEPHEFYLSAYDVFIENSGMMVRPNQITDFSMPKFKEIVPYLQRTSSPPNSMVTAMVNYALSEPCITCSPGRTCLTKQARLPGQRLQADRRPKEVKLVDRAMEGNLTAECSQLEESTRLCWGC